MKPHAVSRRIEIDAAHRIPDHRSKCRHLHGHRYVVEATCRAAALRDGGIEHGMVLDFGFLKALMREVIDTPCDHGLIVSRHDTLLLDRLAPDGVSGETWRRGIQAAVADAGHAEDRSNALGSQLYVIEGPPTAEVLAEHWFGRLEAGVHRASEGWARLAAVTVWETPNCYAVYAPEPDPADG